MNRVDAAPELLQGVTALRLGLVDREGLTAGLIAWNATGGRGPSLASLLVGRGLLRADRLPLLETEVASVLRAHGGSTERALAKAGPLATEFGRLLESDPFQTLSDVVTEPEATMTHVGESSAPVLPGTVADSDTNPATTPIVHGSSPPSSLKMPTGPDPFATIADEPTNGNAPPETIATDSPDATIAHSRTVDGVPLPSIPGSDYLNLRYQVLRMHAKGGLGQVFVARDSELNREVALKEIQGKYADQQESRLRFLIEAEVTGGLEHPGIVPVYGLGRYPDGRPYYAMRFIRGQSMKEAIEQYHHGGTERDPSTSLMELRKLLGQLVDVCNAMSYAHSRGVLHRDLKPGNIMLGSFGETLVVDWGLAKFKDTPEGTEGSGPHAPIRPMSAGSTSRTLFGSAVGTPQFMSPEQAAGQLDKLGPGSDIYSLGVILYAILTGESAFPDKSLTTILDKVRKGEFSPPKAVNHATHPALNAICLKAMALRPEDRYRSARDLADDIEHWLADEPVSVYREPFLTRVARWAKRHKTAVASVAALLITALVSLGIYSVLIKQEQAHTARFYGLARFAVNKMLTELGQEDLADIPQMELVRRKMLTEAQTFYTRLLTERGHDPAARDDVARAGIRLGDIETLLGEDARAETHYGEAITTLQALHKGKPDDRSYRDDLGRAYHSRGLLLRKLNRLKEAESDFNEALKYRTDLTKDAPATTSYQRDRIDTLYHLAALHAKLAADAQSRAKVRNEYQEVIKAQEAIADGPESTVNDRRLLGRYLNNLAILLNVETSDRKDALETFRKAEAVQADVVKRQPQVAITRYERARTNGNMHLILASQKSPEAEERGRRDVEILRQLTQEFPRITDFRQGLVAADLNLGKYLRETKRLDLAGKELDEAVTLGTELVKTHGERRECRYVLAAALLYRGALRKSQGKPEQAEADLQAARETLQPLADAKPPVVDDLIRLGGIHYQLAELLKNNPKRDVISELDQAIALHKRAGLDAPLWLDYKLKFALLQRRTDAGVLKELDEAVAIASSLVKDHAESRECRSIRVSALTSRGAVLTATGQPAKAEEDLLKARDLLKPVGENVEDIKDLGLVHYNLALVRDKLGHADEAMADLEDAIRLHERTGATNDAGIPWLWFDLELKCTLLAKQKPKRDYLAEAETAERLPTLRPNHADSAIRAARSLARCTYDVAYEGKPDNPAVRAKQREYADRTLKVLRSAAESSLIQAKELNEELYKTIKHRPEFAKIREILERKP